MSKKKKELANFKSELHTISPLPLELVAERLRDLERKDLPINIQQLSEDEFGFVMRIQSRGHLSDARVLGTIWRWNGNFTRVDVDSRIELLGQWLDVAVQVVGVVFAIIVILPFLWIFSGLIAPNLYSNPVFSLFLLVILVAGATVAILAIKQFAEIDPFARSRYRSLRDIDSMMQAIADKLSENQPMDEPVLEFDGSETSLAALLQNEKFRHLSINSDGEIEDS